MKSICASRNNCVSRNNYVSKNSCISKNICVFIGALLLGIGVASAQDKSVKLKIVETSDIHGNYYPYDFMLRRGAEGSLARIHTFIQKEREEYKDNLLLLDNGDILQGQPCVYYYNYIDTVSPHLAAEMLNFMKYDVGNVGNHDVETGRTVFDRWAGDCKFPILGANIVDVATGQTHFKPYQMLERDGVKIAVMGMITPAIPVWLPEKLWKGLRFDDMEETARRWMKVIQEKEKPDLVIGIFHSGQELQLMGGKYRDNASLEVARKVPGFDIVLMGHDHARELKKIENVAGDSVLIMNPANKGLVVANADVTLKLRHGKVVDKQIQGALTEMKDYDASEEFMSHFSSQFDVVRNFVSKKIGRFAQTISTRQAYFGSSAFVDLIHTLQLEISGAEISFAAPLSYDTEIREGDVSVSDMFNLYKYENMLYTMRLSGKEVKGLLEMSYGLWTNQMKSPEDHLLLLRRQPRKGDGERASFQNFSYNFDSAAGIIYTVDVTKPQGEKVTIVSMADGTPFEMDRMYRVALNSYRGNGGGELLTKGAGIPQDELKDRILSSTDKDLRYYLMQYIEKKGLIEPRALGQWNFVPEEWTIPAAKRDYECLFGEVEK